MAPRLLVSAVPDALTLPVAEAFAAVHGADDDVFWLDDHEGWSVFGAGARWLPAAGRPLLDALAAELVAMAPAAPEVADAGAMDVGENDGGVTDAGETAGGVTDAGETTGGVTDAAGAGLLEGLAWRPGLVGWLDYGLTAETLGVPVAGSTAGAGGAAAGSGTRFLHVDRAVAVAPGGRMLLVAWGEEWRGGLGDWRDRILTLLGRRMDARPATEGASAEVATDDGTGIGMDGDSTGGTETGGAATESLTEAADGPGPRAEPVWRDDRAAYVEKVRACQESIRRGDAYVLNLTTEVVVAGVRREPLEVFLRLRATAPTRHGGFVRIGGVSLVSSSPESFLELDGAGGVVTRPVKGTRPRSSDPRLDRELRDELAGSPKERAENTMIVDLMRNDLAWIATPGSVEVTALLEVESVRQVHQLVSTVRGRLADGVGVVDVVRAAFPAGSMTGAPKRSAVEILDGLEGRPRGIYSGAFGFLGADGRAGLAMTIRSIVLEAGVARVGVGGGVTALSDPGAEHDEVLLKARAMLEALA